MWLFDTQLIKRGFYLFLEIEDVLFIYNLFSGYILWVGSFKSSGDNNIFDF